MLKIFDKTGGQTDSSQIMQGDQESCRAAVSKAIWFDLLDPTPEEISAVEKVVGVDLPSRDELQDIEPSSRLYFENGALYLTASLAYRSETHIPGLTDTGFILAGNRLVTIRHAEPRAFKIFVNHFTRTDTTFEGAVDILLHLLEAIVDRAAEVLEGASREVDNLTTTVFHAEAQNRPDRATHDLEDRLSEIASLQRLVSKIRESLITLARVAGYLQAQREIIDTKARKENCRSIARDVASLGEHAGFIANNVTFLLDACLGLISVQQNNVMKIFSILAVILLPPTFIGAIYGMNFKDMPELQWAWGYPYSLGLMVLSALVPYLWFRHKGWW